MRLQESQLELFQMMHAHLICKVQNLDLRHEMHTWIELGLPIEQTMFFQTERILSADRPFMEILTNSGDAKIPYCDESRSTMGSKCRLSGPWNESEEARDSYPE
jgi:hypothetical protein